MRFTSFMCLLCFYCFSLNGQDDKLEKINDYLVKMEERGFSGSVLVANSAEILHLSAHGLSSKEKELANSSQTIFDIGSITKQFTAAAILKLEMQGLLSIEDQLSDFFDNLPGDKENITIHQLLTHSAGFTPALGDDYSEISKNEFIDLSMGRSLLFEPGTAYEYSNVGYSLLGIIVEQLSGLSYEDYLQKYLFEPSGMKSTGYLKPDFEKNDVAVGYRKNGSSWGRPNEKKWDVDGPFWHLRANGGILSTVEDMYKWHLAILSEKVLDSQAMKKYLTPYVQEGEGAPSYYAYGWAIYTTSRGTKLATHNGGNGIFFADFWRYLDDDLVIIVMTNQAKRRDEQIAQEIGAIYFLKDYSPEFIDREENAGIEQDAVEDIVQKLLEAFKSNQADTWKDFLTSNCTSDFVNMVPMQTHLEYFQDFHTKFKISKMTELSIEDSEVLLTLDNDEGTNSITINIVKVGGDLKIEGLMID